MTNGVNYERKEVEHGLLGSVLGLLLYSILKNDLPQAVEHNSEAFLCTDDAKIYMKTKRD